MKATRKDLTLLLDDVARALEALEDLQLTVGFDSADAHSVEAAIQAVEAAIDARVAPFRGHPLIESAVAELKAECRAGILDQVAEQKDAGEASATADSVAHPKRTLH